MKNQATMSASIPFPWSWVEIAPRYKKLKGGGLLFSSISEIFFEVCSFGENVDFGWARTKMSLKNKKYLVFMS